MNQSHQARKLREQILSLQRKLQRLPGKAVRRRSTNHIKGTEHQKDFEAMEAIFAMAMTVKETEVLALIMRSWGNRKISQRLKVTESAVKFHITRILKKMGVKTRLELIEVVEKVRKSGRQAVLGEDGILVHSFYANSPEKPETISVLPYGITRVCDK